MTEAEWLRSENPTAMLQHLGDTQSGRKLRLFAVACCRRVSEDKSRARRDLEQAPQYLTDLEQEADGLATPEAWDDAIERVLRKREEITDRTMDMLEADFCAFMCAIDNDPTPAALWASVNANIALSNFPLRPDADEVGSSAEAVIQAAYLRDIFGNPFRPVTFDVDWRTSTAVAIAQGMYEARDFGAMPILADALQDAGCDDDAVLAHCRDASLAHVRGCWVVDLVLGKG